MATKYCDTHGIWYEYSEGCPECTKFGRIAGNIVGGIIGGSIVGVAWAGKKIYSKIKKKNADIEVIPQIAHKEIPYNDTKKYCMQCGKKLLSNSLFCTNCGTKI
jgi:hypothetical protein